MDTKIDNKFKRYGQLSAESFRMLCIASTATLCILLTQLSWAQTIGSADNKWMAPPTPALGKASGSEFRKPWPGTLAQPPSAPYIWDFSKPFNEYTWVAAHNAYLDDTTEQLERGVRALMWDVYPFRSDDVPTVRYDAYLCHKTPLNDTNYPCSAGYVSKKKFSTEIDSIIKFLEKEENKTAVVSLFLEDRTDHDVIQSAFSSLPELQPYLFNINDYVNTDSWPTLQQIISSNKRIIIFFERQSGNYLFGDATIPLPKDSEFMLQNVYDLGKDITAENWACDSRWDNIPYTEKNVSSSGFKSWLRLFVMNQFHAIFSSRPHAAQVDNNLTWLEYRVDHACADADGVRMVPNYIGLDFSQVGDAFPYAGALTEGGVYFYENNDGVSEAHPTHGIKNQPNVLKNEDVVCVLPTSVEWYLRLKAAGCENDETRSLALRGVKKDTSIKLFDKPNASKSDDYTVINVLRDIGLNERVVVKSYEGSYKDADVEVTYNRHNGLDGKVSHITIEPVTGSIMPKIKFADDKGNDVCSVPVDSATSFEMGSSGDPYGCSNDDAQSLQLTGALAGSTITLFGNKNADERCTQGCVRLFVRKDMTAPFSIGNLDTFGQRVESADKSVLAVRYGGTQQLAGKVSYMTVSMGSFSGQDVVPASAEADGSFGSWGAKVQCPVGRFAWGFSLKIERNQGSGDNTGLNSVKMFCSDDGVSNPIESASGGWGDWSETYKCSSGNGPLKGFAMRTLWPRDHKDEVVATDIIGICQDGARIGGAMPEDWGSWSSDFICPTDLRAVGFITRVDDYHEGGDDTALNGMRMYCGRDFEIVLPVLPVIQQVTPDTSIIYWDDSKSQDGVAEFEISGDGQFLTSTHTNFTEFNSKGISTVSVTAVDFDGNRSSPKSTPVLQYDTSPPVALTGLNVVNSQGGLYEISWDKAAAPPNELVYEVSIDNQVQGETTQASMAINDLMSPANFTLSVRAHKFNNTYSPSVSIFIDRTAPPPPAALGFNDFQKNSLILTWAASVDDTQMKDYAVYKDNVLLVDTPETTAASGYLDTGINYTFSVKARDAADNYSDLASIFVDREAPEVPKEFKYSDVTDTSVKLSWSPPHDNVAVTGYSITRDDGEKFDTKTPDLSDITLKPVTTYHYEVRAYDANLNTSQPAELLVDRIPPSAPADPQYSDDTGTTLLLKWPSSVDDTDVTGYNIYREGLPEAIGTTASTSFTATGLTPATTYTFYFEAFDAAGNKSVRTPLLVDRIPPVLAPFFYAYGTDTAPPLLKWQDATDDTGVIGYELALDGKVIQAASDRPVKTTDLGLSTSENHTFTLRAYDAAGNYSASKDLVLYQGRPNKPIDIKGTSMPGGGVIFDWFRGDDSTTKYSVQTDTGVDQEQSGVQFSTSVNKELSPPSVTAKVEAINSEGAKSLSVFCKKINPASPAYPICELSDHTNSLPNEKSPEP